MRVKKLADYGSKLMQGNEACAAAALAADCKFMAGYPITPATEIPEYLSSKMFGAGGVFMQMEDELASVNACIGASWGGARAMTATSGPGFALMLEAIGYAAETETPTWSSTSCAVVRRQVSPPAPLRMPYTRPDTAAMVISRSLPSRRRLFRRHLISPSVHSTSLTNTACRCSCSRTRLWVIPAKSS